MNWNPDRQSALQQLQAFLPQAGNQYSRGRNFDYGEFDDNQVSGLSPWIRCGVISEPEVLQATLRQHSRSAAEKFVMEVFWRSYFKGWLQHRPQVWLDYQHQLTGLIIEYEQHAGYQQALAGKTGISCFDAWVKELKQTGYLHNHSRMWFASIWIFTLKLPWQLGASLFMHHLLDGDPAANTLSWRWVAGLHTRGKTYLARPDNISRYTGGRFDPVTGLATQAAALTEEQDYPLTPLTFTSPLPTDDNCLLITDECCHAETILPLQKTRSVFGLLGTAGDVTDAVQNFRDQAVTESCDRVSRQLDIPTSKGSFSRLLTYLQAGHVKQLITVAPPVGPTCDMLELLQTRLKPLDITLLQHSRPYDRLCWPQATAGFFKLKNKIPAILQALELSEGGQQTLSF